MSKFVEVKTSELTDVALDWALAVAERLTPEIAWRDDGRAFILIRSSGQRKPLGAEKRVTVTTTERRWWGLVKKTREVLVGWEFLSYADWSKIRRHLISLEAPKVAGGPWMASAYGVTAIGHDIGPACSRAIVAAKLGDVVQIPAVLVEVGK